MATPPKGNDLRVRRTRQSLFTAFQELIQEQGFSAIHVHDLTERAKINRGTFYAHFADKYALLDSLIREQFQQALADALPPIPYWGTETLRSLILIVLHYFQEFHRHCRHPKSIDPLFERSIQNELEEVFFTWLTQVPDAEKRWPSPIKTIAQIVSWSIFGAAVTWSQDTTSTMSAEQMTDAILNMITRGIGPL